MRSREKRGREVDEPLQLPERSEQVGLRIVGRVPRRVLVMQGVTCLSPTYTEPKSKQQSQHAQRRRERKGKLELANEPTTKLPFRNRKHPKSVQPIPEHSDHRGLKNSLIPIRRLLSQRAWKQPSSFLPRTFSSIVVRDSSLPPPEQSSDDPRNGGFGIPLLGAEVPIRRTSE